MNKGGKGKMSGMHRWGNAVYVTENEGLSICQGRWDRDET